MNGRLPVLMNVARPRGESDPLTLAERALAAGLDGSGRPPRPRLLPSPPPADEPRTARPGASCASGTARACVVRQSGPSLHPGANLEKECSRQEKLLYYRPRIRGWRAV